MNKILYIVGSFFGTIANALVRWGQYFVDGFRDAYYWQEREAAKAAHPTAGKTQRSLADVMTESAGKAFASMVPTREPRRFPDE